MNKQGCLYSKTILCALLFCSSLLTGCLSNAWTGANLIYDRHNLYKKLTDYQLAAIASHAMFHDFVFKRKDCLVDLAVFNGDILLAGHVPSKELRQIAQQRLAELKGYRRIYIQLDISSQPPDNIQDSWITTKIRTLIFADSEINPQAFKVITSDQVVYLMGDVRPQQASKVIALARKTKEVKRVVKIFNYYNLSKKAAEDS